MTVDQADRIEREIAESRVGVWRRFREQPFTGRFLRNRTAVCALGYLVLLVLVAVFAPWIAPHDPDAQNLGDAFADPFSAGHLLGADNLGRDVLSRLIVADRVALSATALALGVALLVGVPPGLVAGYFGGWVDRVVMRISDAVQSLPPLIIAIALIGALGPGLRNSMLALGFIFAPNFIRIVRAAVLEVREETFVEASRSIGTPTLRIMVFRIIPNTLPPILVQISLVAGFSLIAEAGLSLLGLGVQPPSASWGSMLGDGYNFLFQQPWLVVFPGVAIALAVLALNIVGDGLRDAIGRGR
ncbi:MAG: ABC transporter permease [Pseudonocardia sp.]|nr:ABC transporter permease [Pseudonocardia sp.]